MATAHPSSTEAAAGGGGGEGLLSSISQALEFYNQRIAHFDTERQVISDYIRMVTPSKAELHILDWENRYDWLNRGDSL